MMKSLKQTEFDSYQKNGFAKVGHKIFTDQDFLSLKNLIDGILAANGKKESSAGLGSMHSKYPEILFWLLSDNILDIAEDILGPHIGYLNSIIWYKKGNTQDKLYWHTDTTGFSKFGLFEDTNLLNLTLSITRSDASNGCLKCLPGTHLQTFTHDWIGPENQLQKSLGSIDEKNLDTTSTVRIELAENEVSIHNVNLVHSSEPNLSHEDRITISTRFFSASKRCYVENFKNTPLPTPFLVRGQDLAGSQLKFLSFSR